MKLLDQSYQIVLPFEPIDAVFKSQLQTCEYMGRLCYDSMSAIKEDSYKSFLKNAIKRGHTSLLEHSNISVIFNTDSKTAMSILRHRHSAYSMQSTRYCNFANDKFDNQVTFAKPVGFDNWQEAAKKEFIDSSIEDEKRYLSLVENGLKPEQARWVLPNGLYTKLGMTCSFTEWRHVFRLRVDKAAHPDVRFIMSRLLIDFCKYADCVFGDLLEKAKSDGIITE